MSAYRPEQPSAAALRSAHRAWDRLQETGGLVARAELAQRWRCSEGTAKAAVAAPDFPAPVLRIAGRQLWLALEADAWRARQPQPGRPTKEPR